MNNMVFNTIILQLFLDINHVTFLICFLHVHNIIITAMFEDLQIRVELQEIWKSINTELQLSLY